MFKKSLLLGLLMLFLTSCQVITSSEGTRPTPVESASTPIVSTLPVPPPTPTAADPALARQAAIAALSQERGYPADQIQLIGTEAVEWRDGCLEVVFPGAACLQTLVPGYRIMLTAYGDLFEYRTDLDGTTVILVPASAVRIAVRQLDGSVQIVPIDRLDTQQEITPAAQSFMPLGGTARGVVYALIYGDIPTVTATDASGTRTLDFIQKPNYGLAVWPGDATRTPFLAWGTHFNVDTKLAELFVSAPDGSGLVTLLSEKVEDIIPYALVAQRFSTDGKSLYFSKEPYGIGGYIIYGGASSLYRIELDSKQVTEIIPLDRQAPQSPFICQDALSPDYTMAANHCSPYEITVLDLESRQPITILPPVVVKDRSIVGSARFSPDNSRVAFAGARGDPDNEQGWLAVSDGLSSSSTLIITSEVNQYFVVVGWLNNDTLLVQTNTTRCDSAECPSQIWTVAVDGSRQIKVADGRFVAFVDGYTP